MFSDQELIYIISTYSYWALALIIALECVGLPIPGETLLIAAAIYAGSSHDLNIWLVIGAAASGAILGSTVGFWIGREGGYRLLLRYGHHLHLTESRIKLGQYLFLRYGGVIIFISRFVALVRVLAAPLAGASHMRWPAFMLFNIAGAIVWATLYGAGAYYLGEKAHLVAPYAAIGVGMAAVFLITAAVFFLRQHQARLQNEAERALAGPLRTP